MPQTQQSLLLETSNKYPNKNKTKKLAIIV